MKRIALISTGGTIAMQTDESGAAVPALNAKELLATLQGAGDQFVVEAISFKNLPSPQITHKDLMELKNVIERTRELGFDGIVIPHGTDTMEETAYFLDMTTKMDIPIVLTGAQRNSSALSSDVQLNLMDSILVAADNKTVDMGVVIVFSSEIIPAREATKTHRSRVDTFKSMEFGPIGVVNNNRVLWLRKPLIRDYYGTGNIKDIVVEIIPSYLGSNSRLIRDCIKGCVDGIIVQGMGAGHVPKAMLPGIQEALDKGIPVVLTSRVLTGRFFIDTYGYEGAERQLRSMGVIFGEDLLPQKARIKLLVLLSLGYDVATIKHEFEKYFYE